MSTHRRAPGRSISIALTAAFTLLAGLVPLTPLTSASANSNPQPIPYAEAWTDTGRIIGNDDWSAVPGAVGYLGQDITTATGADPRTLLTESTVANDVDVIANQTMLATVATFLTAVGRLVNEITILEMYSSKASSCPADSNGRS